MLEREPLDAEVLEDAHQHQDLVGAVAVAVDEHVAGEDVREGLQAAVDGRQGAACLLRLSLRGAVGAGLGERLAVDLLDAHPRRRADAAAPAVDARRVLAEGELDGARGALEQEPVRVQRAPAELDGLVLAADGVRRAVHGVDGRHAARQRAVDADVRRVERVAHLDLGHDRVAGLVHRRQRDVAVRVDDAGRDVAAGHVDHRHAARRLQALPDPGDLAVRDQDVGVLQRPAGDRVDGAAAQQHAAAGVRRGQVERRLCRRGDGEEREEKGADHRGTRYEVQGTGRQSGLRVPGTLYPVSRPKGATRAGACRSSGRPPARRRRRCRRRRRR